MAGASVYFTEAEAREVSIALDQILVTEDNPPKELESFRIKLDVKFGWRDPKTKEPILP